LGQRETAEDRQQEAALLEQLKGNLLQALVASPDTLAALQREYGHELVRLQLLHPRLRFVDRASVMADRPVSLPPPAPVIDVHDAGNVQLLALVEQRLHEDRSIRQEERETLAQLALDLLKRLGGMSGRSAAGERPWLCPYRRSREASTPDTSAGHRPGQARRPSPTPPHLSSAGSRRTPTAG
jgi:hypothetical protein